MAAMTPSHANSANPIAPPSLRMVTGALCEMTTRVRLRSRSDSSAE